MTQLDPLGTIPPWVYLAAGGFATGLLVATRQLDSLLAANADGAMDGVACGGGYTCIQPAPIGTEIVVIVLMVTVSLAAVDLSRRLKNWRARQQESKAIDSN